MNNVFKTTPTPDGVTAPSMVVASCLIAAVSAGPPEKTPVMIGFKDKPDPGLIRAHGGEITYEYHIVPAIAASLPEQAIQALKNNPNIEYIEPDCEVAIAEEVLPWNIDRIDLWRHYGVGKIKFGKPVFD